MRNCIQCNKQIDDQAVFCPHCGAKTGMHTGQQRTAANMRLHCPRCKSTNLSAMSETVGSVGSATRVGKRSAVGGTTALRQRSWICHQCGNIFRNVDDLAAENAAKYKTSMVFSIIIFGGIALFALLLGMISGDMGTAFVLILTMIAFIFGCGFLMKKVKAKGDKEVEQLRYDCFN